MNIPPARGGASPGAGASEPAILAGRSVEAHEEAWLAGRVCGWLFALGGVTLPAQLVLPGIRDARPGLVAVVSVVALVWGLTQALVIRWDRAPWWLVRVSVAFGLVLVVLAVLGTGGPDSASWIYFFFVAMHAACFFPRRVAHRYILASVAAHALPALYAQDTLRTHLLPQFVIAAPAYVVLGVAVLAGRDVINRHRDRAEELANRQGALRRVATAVVSGRPDEEIYELVAHEVGGLHGAGGAGILRVESDRTCRVMGSWTDGSASRYPPGTIVDLRADGDVAEAIRTSAPVRISAHAEGSPVRLLGHGSSIVTPITVSGRVWGVLALSAPAGALGRSDEEGMTEFGDLLATAILGLEDRAILAARASSDPLTGLDNHRTLQERLAVEVARAVRHGLPLSVALLDVDGFKLVNDTSGHEAGDEVLTQLADSLRRLARAEDVLGRVGGDEFAWVMPETDRHQALAAVERARPSVARATGGRVTVSAGICDLVVTDDPGELLRLADGALYWAKAHGRDQCWVYDPATVAELSAQDRAEQLERSRALAGLRALARAIDAKDSATHQHSERVARLAGRLATAAGWSAERARLLAEAALVHDVGKIGIPDAVLGKVAPITPQERAQIAQHVDLSARIVEDVLSNEQVEWIRMHHERPDGNGYPTGAGAERIPAGSALLSLADAWDVMTIRRPYSAAKTVEDALAEVTSLVGAQFSPLAVAALLTLHRGGELTDGAARQLDGGPESPDPIRQPAGAISLPDRSRHPQQPPSRASARR